MALIFNETVTVTTAFAYDAANELTAQTTGGVTTSYTYDDWGRTSSKSMRQSAGRIAEPNSGAVRMGAYAVRPADC